MSRRRLTSDALSVQGISHGFFTRYGGVSSGIYTSLNCGFGSQDETSNIVKNRSIVAEILGATGATINTPYQSHSTNVTIAEQDWKHDQAPKADAVVTKTRNLVIGILTADCAPVLFADPVNKVIAAAHAGWRGALNGVLENTIEEMRSLGAQRRHIIAVVGPCIGQDNYEVGPEFYEQFLARNERYAAFFHQNPHSKKHHFNLPEFALERLKKIGVKNAQATMHCTYGDESLFFSYRRNFHNSVVNYGRQISSIVIN